MATIVNTTPSTTTDSSSGVGFLIGALLLIGFFLMIFYFGAPMMRSAMRGSSPQITVPDRIDVNVNQPQTQAP